MAFIVAAAALMPALASGGSAQQAAAVRSLDCEPAGPMRAVWLHCLDRQCGDLQLVGMHSSVGPTFPMACRKVS